MLQDGSICNSSEICNPKDLRDFYFEISYCLEYLQNRFFRLYSNFRFKIFFLFIKNASYVFIEVNEKEVLELIKNIQCFENIAY